MDVAKLLNKASRAWSAGVTDEFILVHESTERKAGKAQHVIWIKYKGIRISKPQTSLTYNTSVPAGLIIRTICAGIQTIQYK